MTAGMLLSLTCLEIRLLQPKSTGISNSHAIQLPSPRVPSNVVSLRSLRHGVVQHRGRSSRASETKDGVAERGPSAGAVRTSYKDGSASARPGSLFYFDAGYALFAKRPSRPFPPAFASGLSDSFSDGLSGDDNVRKWQASREDGKHKGHDPKNRARDKADAGTGTELSPGLKKEMEIIKGVTNGDDAILANERFIGANDGVGAWATKENGHAA